MAAQVIGLCSGCHAACGTHPNNPNPAHTPCLTCGYQILWSAQICGQCGMFEAQCVCILDLDVQEPDEHKDQEEQPDAVPQEDPSVMG